MMETTTQTRIYNKKVKIEARDVLDFYEKKSKSDIFNIAFLNDKLSPDLRNLRNEKEKDILKNFLRESKYQKNTQNPQKNKYKVLEAGCGMGRWVENLGLENIEKYDGIDFVENFIEIAKEKYKNQSKINFYKMAIENFDFKVLEKNYDLIIICGVSMYVNDDELLKLYKKLNNFLSKGSKLYLQESISTLEGRLTLKNFYSDEMKMNYSAIYRTTKEYIDLINETFEDLTLTKKQLVLTPATGSRKETNSCCFCYEKI